MAVSAQTMGSWVLAARFADGKAAWLRGHCEPLCFSGAEERLNGRRDQSSFHSLILSFSLSFPSY